MEVEIHVEDFWKLDALLGSFAEPLVNHILDGLASNAHKHWVDLVFSSLNTTRDAYKAGLLPPERISDSAVQIVLEGALPNMIEFGASSFDMHDTMLQAGARGVKTGKDGALYRDVPFQHMNPKARGLAMGSQFIEKLGEDEAKKLGRRVYRQARDLERSIALDYGGRPKLIHRGGSLQKDLAQRLKGKLTPEHRHDIYAGMLKVYHGEKKTTSYHTFRRISKGSDGPRPAGTWLHPGFDPPRDFIGKTLTFVEQLAPQIIDTYVQSIMSGKVP
jgi:hypothetical protein